MSYVPYLIAVLCGICALRLPRGKDLAVAIALVPFWALEVEVGLSIKVSEAIMVLLVARHFFHGNFRTSTLPGITSFFAFILLALIAAMATIEFGPEVPQFAGGGTMRNGYGRVVTTFAKTMILFAFLVVITSNRRSVDPFFLLKTYVYSCLVLATMGLIQMVVFLTKGIDIFPIGMFVGDGTGRAGTLSIQGQSYLRVCSLGGEPKGLGQALAVALCILVIFAERFSLSRTNYRLATGLLFSVVILTSSTSAFVTLIVVTGFISVFSRKPTPFTFSGVRVTLCLIAAVLVSLFYTLAACTDTLAPVKYSTFDSYWDSIVFKLTDRVRLDDTDSLVMESFVDAPLGLAFGRGLGLVHHYAHSLMPPHMARYMRGSIIIPKSGIAHYLGHAGILGLLLIVQTLSHFVPVRNPASRRRTRIPLKLMTGIQSLSFGLFAALLLRLYTREIIWIAFACVAVIQYQIQCGLITNGSERQRMQSAFKNRNSCETAVRRKAAA